MLKQILPAIIICYIFGMLWYRFSDRWQHWLLPGDVQSQYFVVTFGLRPEIDYDTNEFVDDSEPMSLNDRLIILVYFALTTLSTVGYGDLFPTSIMEKAFGVAIEIIGVTIFSILMNNFAEITISIIGNSFNSSEERLVQWFAVIKLIRN